MCDICPDVVTLFVRYDNELSQSNKGLRPLNKAEILTLCTYVQAWNQRQCTCCYKDGKNFDRFNALIQGLILSVLNILKEIHASLKDANINNVSIPTDTTDPSSELSIVSNVEEKEKLFIFVAKIFLLNFPLYMAFKHSVHSKLEEISQDEVAELSNICDVNDMDIPAYLLRNVCFFAEKNGIKLLTYCFEESCPETLSLPLAHAMICLISNIKLWLNLGYIVQFLVPLRSAVIRYLCKISDKDLRVAGSRTMFEYMWTAFKDPLDAHATFDKEGLDLAFKYFSSSTLTMRLSGIAQINNYINIIKTGDCFQSHINMYSDSCQSDNLAEVEGVGSSLSNWLLENKIIQHIFGPNLHVEIIKLSQIVLNFLALEGKLTNSHIETVWAAAQLKHCSRQVLDLLTPLMKNIEVGPATQLYKLLFNMDPKDHTEQTLLLASALIKYLWVHGGATTSIDNSIAPFSVLIKNARGLPVRPFRGDMGKISSSEKSLESEDEHGQISNPIPEGRVLNPTTVDGPMPTTSGSQKPFIRQKRKWSKKEQESSCEDSEMTSMSEDSEEMVKSPIDSADSERQWSPKVLPIKRMKMNEKSLSEEESPVNIDMPKKLALGELPELVKAVFERDPPQYSGVDLYECRQYFPRHPTLPSNELVEDILSPDEGSCNSSHVSNKSEKNMGDFDGEESCCDEELAQITSQPMTQRLSNIACLYGPSHKTSQGAKHDQLDLESVCKPGQTLLWDLLQDDKINFLADGMAVEAEKITCSLVCWTTDKLLRMKFIEGCLDNLANNRSVIVSLRLLPKLLNSFHQFRANNDSHFITLWADKEHKMMKHFFNNLIAYTSCLKDDQAYCNPLYSHKEQIQVRLHFLTCVYSMMASPENFRLGKDQLDTLWSCLSTDPEGADELFSWFLNQAKSKEHHALSIPLLKYVLHEKLPQLAPETTSMIALNLLQHLSGLSFVNTEANISTSSEANINGMQQLWGIALQAINTDVSTAAIQYLNGYYLNVQHGTLEKEEEFIERCMKSLSKAMSGISEAEDKNLTAIQRALLLLKTHIEAFCRRYAYHLRLWKLKGQGIKTHKDIIAERHSSPLRVICQPATVQEKVNIDINATDLVADLRAEISFWWEEFQAGLKREKETSSSPTSAAITHPTLMTEGPIRMITQGQELTSDLDEKTLSEMNFKDAQLVYVSVGSPRPPRRKEGLEPASALPPPPRESLPHTLLLQPVYFEQLFGLMQQLGSLRAYNKTGEKVAHTKAQVLSRRVWDILMMLPTCPTILQGFKNITVLADENRKQNSTKIFQELLDPSTPPKLMYSLQIVEALLRPTIKPIIHPIIDPNIPSSSSNLDCQEFQQEPDEEADWTPKFVEQGGMRHLFDIFTSGVLQARDGEEWNEWDQDCMACMLKLIYHFGVIGSDPPDSPTPTSSSGVNRKRQRKGSVEKVVISRLNKTMLQMMSNIEPILKGLLTILYEAAVPGDPNTYKTGFWGKAQVVQSAMKLLVAWAFSEPSVRNYFFEYHGLESWLKRLVLEDPEPALRREACTGLYQFCLGATWDGVTGHSAINPLLQHLLTFLSFALNMKHSRTDEEEKEPYGPGCKDYFWLLCRLIDSLDDDALQNSPDQKSLVDLESLIRYVASAIKSREYRETRHNTIEDDGLRGLLNLATVVTKHNPPFKFTRDCQEFVSQIFEALFALPSPVQRYLPKCKSQPARQAAFDLLAELVKDCEENYHLLHSKLYRQHSPETHMPYPWDYWPHEDGRSECGYVGLTNLGATCYLASCIQHLYMMPQARASILSAKITPETKHEDTLRELQRMFAYLMESERKAYNPRVFCKMYTMDHQPLNTGEQKDMAEFFTDFISKLEEMTGQLKELVKNLFCGTLSNNVVSLDCPHISRTLEEFYTLRCQVSDMRNLYDSLDELTVKDTLEGDNMYTCSQCGKKVRAEKRACIKKLPRILCFNTMRYTFNMLTMTKEKVNTHFSFPMRLDMANYMEKNLVPSPDGDIDVEEEGYEYDLIGVTVHTGTADGGHYYSFIRERQNPGKDKWFLFNDAEVKLFDPSQLAAECFGGEMTSKTYDSVTDKFMDFSFEKTNSAYMLFYERIQPDSQSSQASASLQVTSEANNPNIELSPELAEWIWKDNMQFLQDKSIFEHTYFTFMWQICSYIPTTLASCKEGSILGAKLGTSFVLETLIHAKEKPTIAQWIELLTKQFNSSQRACEWFLDHMSKDSWWPVQILIKCPNQVVRQLFQRLCIHVINQLKPFHSSLYLQPYADSDDSCDIDMNQLGQYSCITRFVKKLLLLIEQGVQQHLKHLTEYFSFLHEFAKMGEEECQFMLSIETISTLANFYLGQKSDCVEVVSDEEEDDDDEVVATVEERYKPMSLEKMISLIALLVEKSRGDDLRLHLPHSDFNIIAGGKGFPFLYQQVRDSINVRQSANLILSVCRWNEHLAVHIINMIFLSIAKQAESNAPFFKLLSMLVEVVGAPSGTPQFTNLVLQRIWEAAEYCPQQCLEWLTVQAPRNKSIHTWVLQSMDVWVEKFLLAHSAQRVRNVAAMLLVSLVPSNTFRQTYRSTRTMHLPQKEVNMNTEATVIMHQIYELLLRLLKRAKHYADHAVNGTTKLTSYFAVMTYCLVSTNEKLMFGPYFVDLWNLFQPKLSEPAIPVHHNKQALLVFWFQACVDCPENVKLIVQNSHVTKNIAFNYILADHDDQEVVLFNRCMLPAYYGLLRLCCQQSRSFTRQLANHQNIQWAFKNITPYTTQYGTAISELFKLMKLFGAKYPDQSEQEQKEVLTFKRTTLRLYLTVLDARACWGTLITVLRTLVDSTEDRIFVISNNGIPLLFTALHTLHMMFHEATACHVTGDMIDLLSSVLELIKVARTASEEEAHQWQTTWRELGDATRRLLTLLNSYTPSELRHVCIDVLQELIFLFPEESLDSLIPLLSNCHTSFLENNSGVAPGPFFPQRGQKIMASKNNLRPPRPLFQMFLHPSQLETTKGVDEEYDSQLLDFFMPYHQLIDTICRIAIRNDLVTSELVNLSAMVAVEGIPLHSSVIPKLWFDIMHTEKANREFLPILYNSSYFVDYLEAVLLDERGSLNNSIIYQLFSMVMPHVSVQVINSQVLSLLSSVMSNLIKTLDKTDLSSQASKINADLRALIVVYQVEKPSDMSSEFPGILRSVSEHCKQLILCEKEIENAKEAGPVAELNITEELKVDEEEPSNSNIDEEPFPPCKRRRIEESDKEPESSSPKEETSTIHWAEVLDKSIKTLLEVLEGASTSSEPQTSQ